MCSVPIQLLLNHYRIDCILMRNRLCVIKRFSIMDSAFHFNERLHAISYTVENTSLALMENKAPYTRKRFPAFLYCLLFSRESRTTSSLLETIQKRRKTFPCVGGLKTPSEENKSEVFDGKYLKNKSEVKLLFFKCKGEVKRSIDNDPIILILPFLHTIDFICSMDR